MSTLFPAQNITGHRSDYTHAYTEAVIRYIASNETTQNTMIQNREIESSYGRRFSKDSFKNIMNALNLFSK